MDVRMFRFSEEKRNLVAFVSLTKENHQVCNNAVILVPGLTDGVLSMNYTELLSSELSKIDFSVVQVNLSSSFNQFGFSNLKNDCDELTQLMKVLKAKFRFQKIVFLGHSTGAQDALYYVRYSEAASLVDAIVLQGAVSDREIIPFEDNAASMLDEAKKLRQEGKEDAFLSNRMFDEAPITASRFLSLAGRLTDDDMFSVDLSEEELKPILSPVKVPISLCFSADDEYVHDKVAQKVLAEKMVSILKKNCEKVDCKYFSGNHGLSKPEYYQPFVEYICDFVKSV